MPYKMPPPTHPFAGSNSERQGVGDPGHCEDCAQVGHVRAHPDLGCGDVGCERAHGPEDEAAAPDALATAEAELDALTAQAKEAFRQYRDLDAKQTAKASEVREMRRRFTANA